MSPEAAAQSLSQGPWILKTAKTRRGKGLARGQCSAPLDAGLRVWPAMDRCPKSLDELTDGRCSHRGSGSTGAIRCVRNMAAHSARPRYEVVACLLGQPTQTWQKNGGEGRGTSRSGRTTRTPMSRPILAEHPHGRDAVGPGNGSVRDATPTVRIRRLAVSAPPQGGQAVQGEIAVSKQQPTGPTVAGGRHYEWLHPSQFPAGLSSMPGFSVAGSNVLPRLRAKARERCDIRPD